MSEVNNPGANEFGTVIQPNSQQNGSELNKTGDTTTLADILAAIRGTRVPDAPAVKEEETAPPAPADKPATGDPLVDADIDTGSKALDIAVRSFITSTGASQADIERATAKAIEYGDPNLIDRAFLRERFGDRADEATAIAEAVLEQADTQRAAVVQSVYAVAGGKEGWDKALSVYKENAPKGLQKAIQLMFDSGDNSAVTEAATLVVEFANNSGLVVKGAGSRQVAGSGTQESQGLSAGEFKAAMSKLNQSSRSYREDYARLIELRSIGKQLGK